MARKYFNYETDNGQHYGASIDADLYGALLANGVWEAINKTGVNGTVYDDFAALDAADAGLDEELPATINPRSSRVSVAGQSMSVIMPAPLNLIDGTFPDDLQIAYQFDGVPTFFQGEQDSDLTD